MLKHRQVFLAFVTVVLSGIGVLTGYAAAQETAPPGMSPGELVRTPTRMWPQPVGATSTPLSVGPAGRSTSATLPLSPSTSLTATVADLGELGRAARSVLTPTEPATPVPSASLRASPTTTPVPRLALSPMTLMAGSPYGFNFQAEPGSACTITATQPDREQIHISQVIAGDAGRVDWMLPASEQPTPGIWTVVVECAPGGRAELQLSIPESQPSRATMAVRIAQTISGLPLALQIAGIVVVSLVLLQALTVAYNALARWQIARHTRGLRALTEAMSLSNRSLTLETALGEPLDAVMEHLQIPVGTIHLLDPDRREFDLVCARGIDASTGNSLRALPESKVVMGEAVRTAAPVRAAGAADQDYLRALSRGEARVCVMSVPISSGNRNIGALTLATPQYRAFTDDESSLISGLGHHLGVVVENLRMVDAMRSQVAQIDAALTDLRASEKSRSELLDNISHDLRAPLTCIRGYIDLLLEGDLSNSAREGLQIVSNKAQQMIGLIEELLASASGTTKHPKLFQLDRAPVELAGLIGACVSTCRPSAHQAGLALEVNLAPELPLVLADAARLIRVFDNLLSNAIKFTPSGGTILVSASVCGGQVEIQIADTGRGIAPDQLEHIFDRRAAYRAENGKRVGGLGLGLAAARDLVTAHGGLIWAESELGKGTVFHFTLPFAPVPTSAAVSPPAPEVSDGVGYGLCRPASRRDNEEAIVPSLTPAPALPLLAASGEALSTPLTPSGPPPRSGGHRQGVLGTTLSAQASCTSDAQRVAPSPIPSDEWWARNRAEPEAKPQNWIAQRFGKLDKLQRMALGAGVALLVIFAALFIVVSLWQHSHW